MKFLLDANAVIAIFKGHSSLLHRLHAHRPSDFGIPVIVVHELLYGAYKSQRREANVTRVRSLQFETVSFDLEDAEHAGQIRALLAAAGTPIGPYDVLIAGQARARDLTLVTHNVGEFQRVPGLLVQDWQQ